MLGIIVLLIIVQNCTAQSNLSAREKEEFGAAMARYIINVIDWVSISTISTINGVKGFPFGNIKAVADGPINKGTGVPYFYLTDLDLSNIDVKTNNKVTIMGSLIQTSYCKSMEYNPQDPRCPRLIMSGTLVRVTNPNEMNIARSYLYTRHPAMRQWPIAEPHLFFIAKLEIQQIIVLFDFGPVVYVKPQDYFNVKLQ